MNINEIIEKLKDILSSEQSNRKIFDKDVAIALGMSKESLSHLKKKNGVPYEQIAKFCAKRKISINWILFEQLPKSLEEETEKYTRIKHFTKINASAGGGSFNYDEDFEYFVNDNPDVDLSTLETRASRVQGDGYDEIDVLLYTPQEAHQSHKHLSESQGFKNVNVFNLWEFNKFTKKHGHSAKN